MPVLGRGGTAIGGSWNRGRSQCLGQPMICGKAEEGDGAWQGSLARCVGLTELWYAGSGGGNARFWDPGRRVQEMAARWSSENVVVEFRDSQVSWLPNGVFWACALFGSLPPTLPGPPQRRRAIPQPGLGSWVRG